MTIVIFCCKFTKYFIIGYIINVNGAVRGENREQPFNFRSDYKHKCLLINIIYLPSFDVLVNAIPA